MDQHKFVPKDEDPYYCAECGQQENRPIHLITRFLTNELGPKS